MLVEFLFAEVSFGAVCALEGAFASFGMANGGSGTLVGASFPVSWDVGLAFSWILLLVLLALDSAVLLSAFDTTAKLEVDAQAGALHVNPHFIVDDGVATVEGVFARVACPSFVLIVVGVLAEERNLGLVEVGLDGGDGGVECSEVEVKAKLKATERRFQSRMRVGFSCVLFFGLPENDAVSVCVWTKYPVVAWLFTMSNSRCEFRRPGTSHVDPPVTTAVKSARKPSRFMPTEVAIDGNVVFRMLRRQASAH